MRIYIRDLEMAPYLKLILSQAPPILSASSQAAAQSLLEKLEEKNKSTLEEIATKLEEAEKTEGETEISDALREKAIYLTRIGNKVCIVTSLCDTQDSKLMRRTFPSVSFVQDASVEALKLALTKTSGLGARIDLTLTLVRVGLFFNDRALTEANLSAAEKSVWTAANCKP